ncbi:MAG: polyphosphate kinase (could be polyphosphate AMP phosphotransferase (pap)) [Micrococcales bacterium]|nr:MAG: polyphosphate kinase (could be polyphosphate AMP phosphotransferase (pap)) [Micrococcales bacterium]
MRDAAAKALAAKRARKDLTADDLSKKDAKKAKQAAEDAAQAGEDQAGAAATVAEVMAAPAGEVADLLRVGPSFDLAGVDTRSTPGFAGGKDEGEAALLAGAEELSELQERLYAAAKSGDKRSVLLVVQGMDTAGKGGIVRHVVGSVDPQGVQLTAFKAPTPQERSKGFLWRIRQALPQAGYIGVFDRSHYEDVLVVRVKGLASKQVWARRYASINTFEKQCAAKGITLVKVMLHISAQEQHERLAERLERPDKYWKYRPGDLDDRALWPDFQEAYQDALTKCSTEIAPWYVVPADRKWYARWAVQQLLLNALRGIDPQWPQAGFDVEAEKEQLAGLDDVAEDD